MVRLTNTYDRAVRASGRAHEPTSEVFLLARSLGYLGEFGGFTVSSVSVLSRASMKFLDSLFAPLALGPPPLTGPARPSGELGRSPRILHLRIVTMATPQSLATSAVARCSLIKSCPLRKVQREEGSILPLSIKYCRWKSATVCFVLPGPVYLCEYCKTPEGHVHLCKARSDSDFARGSRMSDLYWLANKQITRLDLYFLKRHCRPRADDRRFF